MLRVSETAIIPRPVDEVFAAASDPLKQLEWDPATMKRVEKLTPGPLGRGSRYRAAFKVMGTVEYDFPDFDPPRRFSHRTRLPMGEMRHTFIVEPVPQGTRLTQEGELRPTLLGRLMQPLMARMLRRRFRTVAQELSEYLEAAPRGAPGTPPQR
jgi:hypothetical protein